VVLKGVFGVIYATPVQFIFELLCIYLIKIKTNDQKASDNCKILLFQLFMSFAYLFLLGKSMRDTYMTIAYGRPGLVFSSLFYCLMVD